MGCCGSGHAGLQQEAAWALGSLAGLKGRYEDPYHIVID